MATTDRNLGIKYKLIKCYTTFTRPANTTAYVIGQAVTNSTSAPTLWQLDLGAQGALPGQGCEVRKIAVVTSAKQTLLPTWNVYLSPTSFTATNDGTALSIPTAQMGVGGSWFNLDTVNSTAINNRSALIGCNTPLLLDPADTKLYGTMQAANAYIPTSAEIIYVIVWIALL